MAYKLYTDKQEIFECDLFLEGADLKDSNARILVETKDLTLLFELIDSYRSSFNKPPIITANFITHNIDYNKSNDLSFVPLSQTLSNNISINEPKTGNMLSMHRELRGVLDYAESLNRRILGNLTYYLEFNRLYNWRNDCLTRINYSSRRIELMRVEIEKYQRIVDGIKLI